MPSSPTMGIMPIETVHLIVYALALSRLAGMVTIDEWSERWRLRAVERFDDKPGSAGWYARAWLTCSWCFGIPLSIAATPIVWFHSENPILLIPALIGAFAQVIGMTSTAGR